MRRIYRSALAICERVAFQDIPGVVGDDLYITRKDDGSFSYEYHYKHGEVPFKDRYTQKTLDNLAGMYKIKRSV